MALPLHGHREKKIGEKEKNNVMFLQNGRGLKYTSISSVTRVFCDYLVPDRSFKKEGPLLLRDHQRERDRVGGLPQPLHARPRGVLHGRQLLHHGPPWVAEVGPALRLHPHPASLRGRRQGIPHQSRPHQQLLVRPRARRDRSLRRIASYRRHLGASRRRLCAPRAAPNRQLRYHILILIEPH